MIHNSWDTYSFCRLWYLKNMFALSVWSWFLCRDLNDKKLTFRKHTHFTSWMILMKTAERTAKVIRHKSFHTSSHKPSAKRDLRKRQKWKWMVAAGVTSFPLHSQWILLKLYITITHELTWISALKWDSLCSHMQLISSKPTPVIKIPYETLEKDLIYNKKCINKINRSQLTHDSVSKHGGIGAFCL